MHTCYLWSYDMQAGYIPFTFTLYQFVFFVVTLGAYFMLWVLFIFRLLQIVALDTSVIWCRCFQYMYRIMPSKSIYTVLIFLISVLHFKNVKYKLTMLAMREREFEVTSCGNKQLCLDSVSILWKKCYTCMKISSEYQWNCRTMLFFKSVPSPTHLITE